MRLNYILFVAALSYMHSVDGGHCQQMSLPEQVQDLAQRFAQPSEEPSTTLLSGVKEALKRGVPDEALLLQHKAMPQTTEESDFGEFFSTALLEEHGSYSANEASLEEEIDMLIGTDGGPLPQVEHCDGSFRGKKCNGNTLPQVKRPWGMNDWVPATESYGENWFFRRSDTAFKGLMCTHMPSPWMGDYANFLILPHGGSELLKYNPSESEFRPSKFAADLNDLHGAAVRLELAPTDRGAALRVQFPPKKQDHRFLTLEVTNGWLEASSHGVHGATHYQKEGANNLTMFIVVKSSIPVFEVDQESSVPVWPKFTMKISRKRLKFLGDDSGIYDLFIGTSFISMEQAELNRQREVGERTVDVVASEGQAAWHEALSTVEVEALDATQRRIFYTNLWKSMLFPRTFYELDASGREVHYSPYTGNIRDGKLVADIGMWDAYHTVFPMLSLLFPEVHQGAIAGLVQASEENMWLPQWPSPGARTEMVGTMGDAVLADAITKCGTNCSFDRSRAYRAIRKDAFVAPAKYEKRGGRSSLAAYIKDGYVPAEDIDESVSVSLGYMLADAAVANAAEFLGHIEDAHELRRRSSRYGVLFNEHSHFFQPKVRSGKFKADFDPLKWKLGFTEGGPWHYRFYVPHDVPGLQRLMGGKLCNYVEEMLTATKGDSFRVGGYWGITHEMQEASAVQKRFGLYAHSNQPVHDILWVAKKAGCNGLADKFLRRAMAELYQLKGYAGDEDNGEMSAWYVLSALGLYQLEPGNPEYVLGSPAIRQAKIRLSNGRNLLITTQNQCMENVYVKAILWTPLDGRVRKITNNSILHKDLMGGGNLTFVMSPTPL